MNNPRDLFRLLYRIWGGVAMAVVGADLIPHWYGMALCWAGMSILIFVTIRESQKIRRSLDAADANLQKRGPDGQR